MMTDDLMMRGSVIAAGDFVLDLGSRTVTGPAGNARLTPKQCELLELLMGVPGQLVSRRTIMQQVWQTDYMEDTRTLDVHVSWLRRNIEPQPRRPTYLVTRRGEGYVFYADGQGGASRFMGGAIGRPADKAHPRPRQRRRTGFRRMGLASAPGRAPGGRSCQRTDRYW